MHTLAEAMKRSTLSQYIDREFDVLIEGRGEQLENGYKRYAGYTPNYLRVNVESGPGESLENQVVATKITSVDRENHQLNALLTGY